MATQLPHSSKLKDIIPRSYVEATTEATFGYGYSQQAPDGIDNISFQSEISLVDLRASELVTVLDFLNNLGGSLPFLVPVVGESDMVVTSGGYAKETIDTDSFNLTITLQEHKFPGVTP